MNAKAKINQQGRLVIPAACREAAGIAPGDEVIIDVIGDGELRLRTKAQAIKKAQALVARHLREGSDPVAALIAERRAEAERE